MSLIPCVAFLRAINVEGHRVQMVELIGIIKALGLREATTFLASGNVLFSSSDGPVVLEQMLAEGLERALGYAVETFVRTLEELQNIAEHPVFLRVERESFAAHNIAFLHAPLDMRGESTVRALETEVDQFVVCGREIHWLCRTKQSESSFSNAVLEKRLGMPATFRTANTLRRLIAKAGRTP